MTPPHLLFAWFIGLVLFGFLLTHVHRDDAGRWRFDTVLWAISMFWIAWVPILVAVGVILVLIRAAAWLASQSDRP